MNENLISEIDALIDSAEKDITADTIRYINIKSESVLRNSPTNENPPFGAGAQAMLDEFSRDAKENGFFTKDYQVGVVSAAIKEGDIDIGIWLHGDVVPAGDGWNFEPYNAVEYKGCVIGRGATDNKGQLAAIFNLLKIF